MQTWPVQDAKARFSEFLEKCLTDGPQMVTRRGAEAAVLQQAALALLGRNGGQSPTANAASRLGVSTAAIDNDLSSSKFLLPGLGDFGDRYFGTL